jgi:hypothetical protein
MPMMENIVHTAKHTVKASVDIQSARPSVRANPRSAKPLSFIDRSPARLGLKNKKAAGQTSAQKRSGLIGGFA